jgi:hypothetical protein
VDRLRDHTLLFLSFFSALWRVSSLESPFFWEELFSAFSRQAPRSRLWVQLLAFSQQVLLSRSWAWLCA